MNDLVLMEIVHTRSKLLGPVNKFLWWHISAIPEQVEEGSMGTILHDDGKHWRLNTHSPAIFFIQVLTMVW